MLVPLMALNMLLLFIHADFVHAAELKQYCMKGRKIYECQQDCCHEDYCDPNPCQFGVNCTNVPNGYQCACPKGFTGKDCEITECVAKYSGECVSISGVACAGGRDNQAICVPLGRLGIYCCITSDQACLKVGGKCLDPNVCKENGGTVNPDGKMCLNETYRCCTRPDESTPPTLQPVVSTPPATTPKECKETECKVSFDSNAATCPGKGELEKYEEALRNTPELENTNFRVTSVTCPGSAPSGERRKRGWLLIVIVIIILLCITGDERQERDAESKIDSSDSAKLMTTKGEGTLICKVVGGCPTVNPCKNDGRCLSLIGGYMCICKPGFTGRNCQLSQCVSQYFGTCVSVNKDDCPWGRIINATCLPPGKIGTQCCITSDKACSNLGGFCADPRWIGSCLGGNYEKDPNLCVKEKLGCCIRNTDESCGAINGECKQVTEGCPGGSFVDNKCAGPRGRKCCVKP